MRMPLGFYYFLTMEKCAIFIDGGYLDKLLEMWGDFPLDYEKFVKKICNSLGLQLLRVYYYNCLPIIKRMYQVKCSVCGKDFYFNFKDDGERKIYCEKCYEKKKHKKISFITISEEETQKDQERFNKKEKFYNKLKKIPQFEVKYGSLQIIGDKFKQKGIDVKMSLDIVDKCFEKQIEHAIIIAGDRDFIPAIMKAKDYGSVVHLYCNKKKVNRKLIYAVDVIHNLKKKFLEGLEE